MTELSKLQDRVGAAVTLPDYSSIVQPFTVQVMSTAKVLVAPTEQHLQMKENAV